MFNRVEYKRAAKAQLKGRWKIPVLTTLLIWIWIGVASVCAALFFSDQIQIAAEAGSHGFQARASAPSGSGLFSIVWGFVTAAFILAQLHLFELARSGPRALTFSDFVDGLNQWWQAIRGCLWMTLWIWLWSLLFVIPGIVKSYSYSMMFYVMAEYPKIGAAKAMKVSKELTRGYKSDLFVADLSFIPLFLLCVLSAGVGFLWLVPYYQATRTNAYHALKQVALDTKRISIEDFN